MSHLIRKNIPTTKKGKKICKRSEYWYIRYKDEDGRWREKKAFKDKVATEQFKAQIDRKMELADAGIIDRFEADRKRALREHLSDFQRSIVNNGNTEEYARLTYNRAKAIIEGCKFAYIGDVKPAAIQQYLSDRRTQGLSIQSSNHYLQAIKQFCRWMVQDQRISESPVGHLKGMNVRTDRRHDRRSLEPDEIRRLLAGTANAPKRFGMTGYERHLLYRFAAETGLRANEIRNLIVGDFDFGNLTVTARAGYSKRRREDVQPVRPDTAALLSDFFAGKLPKAKAFGGTYKQLAKRTSDMIEADLAETEIRDKSGKKIREAIPYIDDAGRFADFHSLRHTTGSLLAASGVHPKVAQSYLRHSKIDLTMSRYTHVFRGQESEAAAKLPDLSLDSRQQQEATGTDNRLPEKPEKELPQKLHKTAQKLPQITYPAEQSMSQAGKKEPRFRVKNSTLTLSSKGKQDKNLGTTVRAMSAGDTGAERRGGDSNPRYGRIPVRRFSKPLP